MTRALCVVVAAAGLFAGASAHANNPEPPKDRGDGRGGGAQVGAFDVDGSASPQGRRFGLGIELGYPSAVVGKYMVRADQGVAVGVGGFSGLAYFAPAIALHVDYLWHPRVLARAPQFQLSWYWGLGGQAILHDAPNRKSTLATYLWYLFPTQLWVAGRVPIGLDLAFSQVPIDLFIEAVPTVLVFPGLSFGVGAGLGARFWF